MASGVHDAHHERVTFSNAVDAAPDEFIDRPVEQLMRRAPRGAVMRAPEALVAHKRSRMRA
jgi:hypothetical protein